MMAGAIPFFTGDLRDIRPEGKVFTVRNFIRD